MCRASVSWIMARIFRMPPGLTARRSNRAQEATNALVGQAARCEQERGHSGAPSALDHLLKLLPALGSDPPGIVRRPNDTSEGVAQDEASGAVRVGGAEQ